MHTPAPWKIGKSYTDEICIREGTEDEPQAIAVCCTIDEREMQSNAKLIATAPELLTACKDVLDIILAYQHIPAQFKACKMLQDVIEKAEVNRLLEEKIERFEKLT